MTAPTEECSPNIQEWKKLYDAAIEFWELAPWEWMSDADVFAVRNSENKEVGYCAIMGAAEEVFGLAVYYGDTGLAHYHRLMQLKGSKIPDDMLLGNNALTLTFEDSFSAEALDKKVLKELELRFKTPGSRPHFRSYRPGHYPWYLTAEECRFLTDCIWQALRVAEDFADDLNHLRGAKKQFLLRERASDGSGEWQERWFLPQPMKRMYRVNIDGLKERIQAAAQLARQPGAVWEIDCFYSPAYIDEKKGQRPYFPMMLMFLDEASFFILNGHLSLLSEWGGDLHEQFLVTLKKTGFRPATLKVRREDVFAYLEPLAAELKIDLVKTKKLPAIDDARKGMKTFLSGGQSARR